MTIHDISADYMELLIRYDEAESDAERAEILDEIVAVHGDLSEKGEKYHQIIANYSSTIDGISYEMKRLQAKKRACEGIVTRLKETMLYTMQSLDLKRLETNTGRWTVQNSPASVTVNDLDSVPERFLIPQPPKVDAKAILAEFKETGEIFDG